MSAILAILQKIIQHGPTVLKLIAVLLAYLGGSQTSGIVSGAYGDSWGNIWTNVLTYGGAAVSWLASYAFPRSIATIEKWLNAILLEIQKRLNIDPKNETDLDEKFFSMLGSFLIKAVELWLKRIGTPPEVITSRVNELKAMRAAADSGLEPDELRMALSDSLAVATKAPART